MARSRRSLVNRKTNFTAPQARPICETWPLVERLAFHETTTRRLSFAEDLDIFREWGARAFGAWRLKVDDIGADRAVDLLKDQELSVSSLSWAGGFVYSGGEAYAAAIAEAVEAVETAATLEASCLVVLPGSRGSYTMNHARKMIIDALHKVGDAAGARGVQIALQPVDATFATEGCVVDSLDKLVSLVVDCDHPQIGMNFDLFHLRNEPRLLERVRELLPLIRLVQLSDCHHTPRNEMDRCHLGEGILPVAELVESLEAVGYRGFYDAPMTCAASISGNYDDVLRLTRESFEELAAIV